jgi:hypothetical protein
MVFIELVLLVGRFPERNEMIVCALSVFAHLEDDPAETTLYPADRSPLISADPLTSIGKCSPIVQSSAENKNAALHFHSVISRSIFIFPGYLARRWALNPVRSWDTRVGQVVLRKAASVASERALRGQAKEEARSRSMNST